MKTLTENKLYTLTDIEAELHIADGVSVMIYDEANLLTKVTFGNWASLKYFGYFESESFFDKHFLINGVDSRCEVNALLSSKWEQIKAKMDGELAASRTYLNMNIVSFVSDGWVIDLDGIVNIVEGVEKVEWYLVEENIFLWKSGKVRGLPTLLVHSNDVKASHACNMEQISDDKLFYLRSRGLPREDATVLMLESYIAKIFGDLEENHTEIYTDVKNRILERIKSK
jgi:Fe-S cluster assembly scaffold protein SufB